MVEYQLQITAKKSSGTFERKNINTSKKAYDCIRDFYSDDILIYESFFVLLLDRSNTTIGYVKISQGGVAGTVVDPKIIAKYAIDTLASCVVLAHNHPSGNLKPSKQDISLTEKIVAGLKLLDIKVLDHIILSDNGYYSFTDEGLI